MNSIKRNKQILFFLLFSICCLITTACENKIKEKEKEEHAITPVKIDAQLLTELAESNLKVVAMSEKAQERKLDEPTRAIFQKIESDHIILKNKIRKIAKDNFIIIPNTLYDTTTLKNFISEINTTSYLLKTKVLLQAELELYKKISLASQNNPLIETATTATITLQNNIDSIQKELNH